MSTKTTIFTDGSSRGNPGPGGWGAIVISNDQFPMINKVQELTHITELGGGEKNTTNNRMELTAAIRGLRVVHDLNYTNHESRSTIHGGGTISIFTDSSYVINGITKWIKGWKNNGWMTKTKDDVLNKDLWMELDQAVAGLESSGAKVAWKYVGGHVGILGNERCDHIATAFADSMKIKLYNGPLSGYDLPKILEISLDEAKLVKKSSDSAHSKAKAYSYVSMVNGVIETHHTWAECEKRVKGAQWAKYKKVVSAEDEARIIAEFEAI